MWPAIIGAVSGVLGAVGGMSGGTDISSRSRLDPSQKYLEALLMGQNIKDMPSYFSNLNALGQTSQNAYDTLGNAQNDFYGKVGLPALREQQNQLRATANVHERYGNVLANRLREQTSLGLGQMGAQFGQQNRVMRMQGADTGLSSQLTALGQMSGNFMTPFSQLTQENYYSQPMNPGTIAMGGLTGLSALSHLTENLGMLGRMSGSVGGSVGGSVAGIAGAASGGF